MKFKQYCTFTEQFHVPLAGGQKINGLLGDGIDTRCEDWSLGALRGPQPPHFHKFFRDDMLADPMFFFAPKFRGKCKEGWLVVNGRDIQVVSELNPEVEQLKELPPNWFFFAILSDGDKVVKAPMHPRNDWERDSAQYKWDGTPNLTNVGGPKIDSPQQVPAEIGV